MREIQPGTRLVKFVPWLNMSQIGSPSGDAIHRWFVQDSLMFKRFLGKVMMTWRTELIDRVSLLQYSKIRANYGLSELEKAWLVGHVLAAGGGTTSSSLLWWLLVMLVYPNVQAHAHAELDKVVGHGRSTDICGPPLSPLYPRDGQRDIALVTNSPLRRDTLRPQTTGMKKTWQSSTRLGTWTRRVSLRRSCYVRMQSCTSVHGG
ncbi:hypothetical protein EDB92DRAFT_1355725 [Lactarius akahatsu]|uniref:Cytochrome P450 n=1 Tax=Lactarius akahatsu TaxID=416441 RepID=A0AAD4LAH1_9AGAM|nr:hypothetical protein EDB92DRAFT_1355725 [Lactarius akahatsu]